MAALTKRCATKASAAQEHAAEASQAGDLNLEFTSLTHPSSSTFVPPVRYRMHEAYGELYSSQS